jgi:hypothetical protein
VSKLPKIDRLPKPLQKAYLLGFRRGMRTALKDFKAIYEQAIIEKLMNMPRNEDECLN